MAIGRLAILVNEPRSKESVTIDGPASLALWPHSDEPLRAGAHSDLEQVEI
jgi:hypothetical protein